MPLTIPNILTVARIIAIPIFIIAYFLSPDQKNTVAVAIFVLAALTDWLDGFLARKLKEVSPFGAFLDPVADKLIVCTALVLLVSDDNVSDQVLFQSIFTISVIIIVGREVSVVALRECIFTISVIIIVGREVSVVALREWMAEKGQRASIATSYLSKSKTFLQMLAIILLLYGQSINEFPTLVVGELLLYIAAALTIWTMFLYLRNAWPILTFKEK